MTKNNKNILILGAGPAGMACGMELHKHKYNFTIVEKDSAVGGLSKTYKIGKFLTDNGPHRFFSKNKYLYQFISNLLKERWIKVNRSTRFYIKGRYYFWPIKIVNILKTMPPVYGLKIIIDFISERLNFVRRKSPKNFEEFVVRRFGKSLAEFNMLNYNSKIWGIKPSKISTDWSEQRIQDLSIKEIISKVFFGFAKPKTMVDEFYYPEFGTGQIYEAIKKVIEDKNKIILNKHPVKVFYNKKTIKSVLLNDGTKIDNFDSLVSSIPITEFVSALHPRVPEKILSALKRLKYRSQVYIFLTLSIDSVTKDQWIYFPDKEIPIGRISEMKNFSIKMCPKGKTSLFVEYFCWENDKVWKMTDKEISDLTITWLVKLGLINSTNVMTSHVFHKKNVYPVYDLNYKINLNLVLDYLNSFENLFNIGRQGRFRYTNQDHSLEMGILAAQTIITGNKFDLDQPGSESEFFEKGRHG